MVIKFKLRYLLLIYIIFPFCFTSAQEKYKLTKPVLEYWDNNLHILYNFPEGCKGIYKVWVEIRDSKGKTIDTFSFNGDIGQKIEPGNNKHITWNIGNDSIYLDEPVSVKVFAQQMPESFCRAGLLLRSLMLPGLGQTMISDRKPYWLTGIVTYGALAGSYFLNKQASDEYIRYINSDTKQDGDTYFEKASGYYKVSKILGYSALGIWAGNLIWMAIMPDKRNRGSRTTKTNLSFKPNISNSRQDISLYLTINLQ